MIEKDGLSEIMADIGASFRSLHPDVPFVDVVDSIGALPASDEVKVALELTMPDEEVVNG